MEKRSYFLPEKTAYEAKMDAQKLAFAPIMFQATLCLRDLGILDYLLKHGEKNREELSEALGLSLYATTVLLEAGLSLGLVFLKEDKYELSKTGYFVVADEMTVANFDFTNDVNYLGMHALKESLLNGKPEGLKVFGEWPTVYEALSQLPEQVKKSWFAFDHYYSDHAFPEVLPLIYEKPIENLLDIGANTGKWTLQNLKYDPQVEVSLMDLPGQINVAKANVEAAGFANRVHYIEANVLQPLPAIEKRFDAIWMSQFLDCFSEDEIFFILSQVKGLLAADGSIYILETFWDHQPNEGATHSLHATSLYFTCIANGNSRMYHSQDLYVQIEKAGLEVSKEVQNIGMGHTLLQCKLKK